MTTDISNLAAEINRQLALYSEEVSAEVDEAAKQLAQEGVERLKAVSPKLTGSYRRGWRVKKVKGKYVIHNKTDYQLTHLLEKGHAIANGTGRAAPKVHIAPVEQDLVEELTRRVIEVIDQ